MIDLQSLDHEHEKLLVVNQVLSSVWRHAKESARERLRDPTSRDKRVPTLIVIDEAHNLVPPERVDEPAEAVARQIERFAAEGRKYALFIVAVTQRPKKVSANVLSECDNLCLLRMTNAEDVAYAAKIFGSVPGDAAQLCAQFRPGDALLIGGFAKQPTLVHGAPRRTVEGGMNLKDDYWIRG